MNPKSLQRANQSGFVVIIAVAVAVIVAIVIIVLANRNNSDGSQPVTPPDQTSQPDPEQPPVVPAPDLEQPLPPDPGPVTGQLPDNWNQLSSQEKIDLNPLGCDITTQIIWASDGSCHDKELVSGETFPFRYVDDSTELICEYTYYQNHQASPYCSVRFRVVLLTTIDIKGIYARQADWPSFISSIGTGDFSDDRCLKLTQAFVKPSVGTYGPVRLGCRDAGLPAVMRQGQETSVTVSINGARDNMSIRLQTNPEIVVPNLRLKTVRKPPVNVSIDYVVLQESLNNPCTNYQVGSGVCGAYISLAVKKQPTGSEVRQVALRLYEKYGPEESIRLTVLRYNGGETIDDYRLWAVGGGPLLNRDHECGRYFLSTGGSSITGWTEFGECQPTSEPGPGYWKDPDLVPVPVTQAPLRYVDNSFKATCSDSEASFCRLEFEVVLLADIDVAQARVDPYSITGFGLIYPPDSDDDNCLPMASTFVSLSRGYTGEDILLACHSGRLPAVLKAGSRHKVAMPAPGPVGVNDGLSVTIKTTPEVTISNISVDRTNRF